MGRIWACQKTNWVSVLALIRSENLGKIPEPVSLTVKKKKELDYGKGLFINSPNDCPLSIQLYVKCPVYSTHPTCVISLSLHMLELLE